MLDQLSLNPDEIIRLDKFGNENKKLQFLASRILLKHMTDKSFSNIGYNEYGKPFIINSKKKVSISHSYNYVAMIINEKDETGIDIELIKPKIKRIAEKFLCTDELENVGAENEIEKLYIYWGAKESLYKLYGNKNLLFKENLFVEPFNYDAESGNIKATISIENYRRIFSLHYQKVDKYMLVYVLNN